MALTPWCPAHGASCACGSRQHVLDGVKRAELRGRVEVGGGNGMS